MVPVGGAAPSTYDRRAFAEGSERPDAFFDTELPDELAGVVHAADFEIVLRAVNRLRAESWALESSKCHALTRWLRAPLSSSLSSALSGAIDAEAVRAGRVAIAEFLQHESEQRWCVIDCVYFQMSSQLTKRSLFSGALQGGARHQVFVRAAAGGAGSARRAARARRRRRAPRAAARLVCRVLLVVQRWRYCTCQLGCK